MRMIPKEMQACIDACLNCYQMCFGMAMTHCLEKGGEHVKPKHFRAMIDCADMCRNSTQMMLMNSPLAKQMCALCAEAPRNLRQGMRSDSGHEGMRRRMSSLRRGMSQNVRTENGSINPLRGTAFSQLGGYLPPSPKI